MVSVVDSATLAIGLSARGQARASAALPAAGAWETSPTELFVSEASWLTIFLTYTRGAAGGAYDWQLEVSPYAITADVPAGAQEWGDVTAYAVGAVVAGVDTQSQMQEEYVNYGSTGAAAEMNVFGPIHLGGAVERIRIRCRETGVVGTPGTLQIEIMAQ